MIKYLHFSNRHYLKPHPFNPTQPEKCFLRLPHQFIFTLVLAGSFSAALSIPKALSLLLSTPTPSLPSLWQWHSTGNAHTGNSIRNEAICTTCEEDQTPGKSQESPTCFSRTSIMLLFTCYPSLYGICRMLLEKLHRLHQWPRRHQNGIFSFFFVHLKKLGLCSGLRLCWLELYGCCFSFGPSL